jgi:hypothetical protein
MRGGCVDVEGAIMSDNSEQRLKKKYEQPKITVISLRPEEAVLGHCKNSGMAGPVGTNCTAVGSCRTPGS